VDSGVARMLMWFIGSSFRRLAGLGTAVAEARAVIKSSQKVNELRCMIADLVLACGLRSD
jgi:hypothetical protein